jgi:hypothetical protein
MRQTAYRQFVALLMLIVFMTTGLANGLRPVLCVSSQMNHFAIEVAHLDKDCCGPLQAEKTQPSDSQDAAIAAAEPGCVDIPLTGETVIRSAEVAKKAAGFEGNGYWALAPPLPLPPILIVFAGEPSPSLFPADDIPDARLIQHRSVVLHI